MRLRAEERVGRLERGRVHSGHGQVRSGHGQVRSGHGRVYSGHGRCMTGAPGAGSAAFEAPQKTNRTPFAGQYLILL